MSWDDCGLRGLRVPSLGLHDDGQQTLFADVVLFVRFDDVVDERTVFWQEHARDLEGFAVPHL